MIEAHELRIGVSWINFLTIPVRFTGTAHYGSGEFDMKDQELMPLFEYNGHKYYQAGWKSLNPIPLTPDILYKCGFIKVGDFDWANGKLLLHDMTEVSDYGFEVYLQGRSGDYYITNAKYLHQLQNLSYALTQTELTINL